LLHILQLLLGDFCNKIGTFETLRNVCATVALGGEAD
jgi:hypothetical protein